MEKPGAQGGGGPHAGFPVGEGRESGSDGTGLPRLAVEPLRAVTAGLDAPCLWWVWPAAIIAAVVYGSLLPLDISWDGFGASTGFGLGKIGWHAGSVEDVVTNILVYVPVGAALMLSRVGLGLGGVGLLAVLLVGGGVSVFAEALQTGIPERVASWTDVALNGFGVFVGAICGAVGYVLAPSIASSISRRWREGPWELSAVTLTLGILVYGLVPFDFVTTTPALHAAFQRAQCGIGSGLLEGITGGSMGQMVSNLRGAAWFALLGLISVHVARSKGVRVEEALGEAVHQVVLLAVLVEVLQALTVSHVFSLGGLVLHAAGGVSGAWYGSFLMDGSTETAVRRERPVLARWLVGAAVFQVLMILLECLGSAGGATCVTAVVDWPPFETLWRLPAARAASELTATALVFAALAGTLGMLLILRGRRRPWVIAALATILVAVASECLHYIVGGGGINSTTLVIALATSILVALTGRFVEALKVATVPAGVRDEADIQFDCR